jgi:hypothetical protein
MDPNHNSVLIYALKKYAHKITAAKIVVLKIPTRTPEIDGISAIKGKLFTGILNPEPNVFAEEI